MRREKRWRFYCDFCGKSSGSGGHMARHEKSCTANPDRKCGMCGNVGIEGFVEALGIGDDAGVERLREAANGCPACMLAGIRQSKLQHGPDDEGPGFGVAFNFKEEKDRFWAELNALRLESEYGYR